jgi:O-antigen/teichoic acid export membrane protein
VAVLILSRGLVLLVAATICWHARAKYDSLVISYFVFSFLVIILGWFIVKPAVASIFRFNYGRLIKTSIPFSAAIFVYAFTSFWGLTYVRSVLGDEQAGYYAIPLRVYQIAVVLGMSVSGVTLPLFHKLAAAREFGVYAGAFGRLVRGMWLICGPIVALCCFIPGFLIRVFASEQYMSAAAIFPWIGFATAFRLVALPAGNMRWLAWLE